MNNWDKSIKAILPLLTEPIIYTKNGLKNRE